HRSRAWPASLARGGGAAVLAAASFQAPPPPLAMLAALADDDLPQLRRHRGPAHAPRPPGRRRGRSGHPSPLRLPFPSPAQFDRISAPKAPRLCLLFQAPESASRRSAMLVLSRKPGEQVVIGNGITLTVVEVRRGRVRLALDAPEQVRILPPELPS